MVVLLIYTEKQFKSQEQSHRPLSEQCCPGTQFQRKGEHVAASWRCCDQSLSCHRSPGTLGFNRWRCVSSPRLSQTVTQSRGCGDMTVPNSLAHSPGPYWSFGLSRQHPREPSASLCPARSFPRALRTPCLRAHAPLPRAGGLSLSLAGGFPVPSKVSVGSQDTCLKVTWISQWSSVYTGKTY